MLPIDTKNVRQFTTTCAVSMQNTITLQIANTGNFSAVTLVKTTAIPPPAEWIQTFIFYSTCTKCTTETAQIMVEQM
jgi:hypothetical protein